jgi:hypothetical protein
MTRIRWTLALFVGLTLSADARAQFFPIFNLPTIVQPGITIHAGGKNLSINGTIPFGDPYTLIVPVTPTPQGFKQVGFAYLPPAYVYPTFGGPVYGGYGPPIYGAIDQRVMVQIINPPAAGGRRGFKKTYDTSGIDLDIEPASKIWGTTAKKSEFVQAPREPIKAEVPRVVPEEKKPAVPDVVKPPPPLPPAEKLPEGRRLSSLGVTAFRDGEYGLAMLRFRQAVDVEPPEPRALFLRAQASIAVGKFTEAAEAIQRGLQIMPDWPLSRFEPRVELYADQDDAWREHRRRLEEAQRLNPKNADLLFLLGYLAWFDNERGVAADYFRQSRALAADPRWCDAFLQAMKN